MNMNIKLLNENAKIPTRGSEYSAGYDLYAAIDKPLIIPVGETRKVDTGVAIECPIGYFGAIYARSGLATKRGLRPANCVGVADSDYRGGVVVALHNDSLEPQTIEPGERIAQLIISPYLNVDLEVVDELSDTVRGASGFGDSGRF
jgi:dUTP pyrophosphatase